MRRWRAADGGVVAELGDGRFAVLRDRRIDRVLAPHADSLDDDLFRFWYEVDGDALVQRMEVETYGEDERRRSDRIEVRGLLALSDGDAPTARDVTAALDAQAGAARAREDELAVRIDRGVRAFAVPRRLREAQRRLVERLVRWDDEVARALLALLEEVVRAPIAEGVAPALAAACAHATFAPHRDEPPREVADAALEGRWGDAQRALVAAADGQDEIDAGLNAAAYRCAERWLRVAAGPLRG